MRWTSVQSKKRLIVILIACAIFFAMIIGRLFYVQVWKQNHYTELAKQNWDREIPFQTERGDIVDRQGDVIVTNKLAPTLYFMPSQNDNVEQAATDIANVLQVNRQQLLQKLQKRAYITKLAPEGKNISSEQAKKIQEKQIDGVYVGVDYVRQYPHRSLMARLLGFTGYDHQGLAGLEYQYDALLKGDSAAIRLYTDAKGSVMEQVPSEYRAGKKGATIQLTIDLRIQQIVERELQKAMVEYDADQALAIAMNPKTGEILSLASLPSYDITNYKTADQTLYNRNLPVFMTYEPGSTFKIITLSAALEEKVVDLEKEHFYDPGYAMVEGARLRCWKREGHKDQTFLQVVENSCNPGFVELGRRLGSDRLLSYVKRFGFGQKTGVGIAGEASGILFSKSNFGPVEAATTAFGQGVSVTPIQQLTAVAAAVNGGKLYEPYIVSKVIDGDRQKTLHQTKPVVKRRVVSEETSNTVRLALESVVANGSGRQAYRDGLRIGGKTGTAQKVENGRYKDGDYIVSFIGFAPANDPQFIVYVAVDHPKSNLRFGGVIAAPIAGQIIEEVQPILNFPIDTSNQLPKKYVWGDELTYRLGNYVHLRKEEVIKQMDGLKIQWHGEGDVIVSQLPQAGQLVKESDTVHLYLGTIDE